MHGEKKPEQEQGQEQEIFDFLNFSGEEEIEEEELETEETDEGDEVNDSEDELEDESDDNDDDSEESEDSEEAEGEIEGNEENDDDAESDDSEAEGEQSANSLEELQQANAKLLKMIEDGVANSLGITSQNSSQAQSSQGSKNDESESSEPTSLAELVGDVDFEEFQDNPAAFIELLQKVVDHTRITTINGFRAELPNIVSERANQAISMKTLVDDFYRDNQDLAAVKKTVSAVAQNVGLENKELSMAEVLQEAAKRTREMLGIKPQQIKAKAQGKPKRTGKKPVVPKAGGKRKNAKIKRTTKLQKQINDLID